MMNNETLNIIATRRSVRHFTGQPIEREQLITLAQAAVLAPSACNIQPWRMVLVESEEMRQKFVAVAPQSWVKDAAAYFVFVGDPARSWQRPGGTNAMPVDCTIAITQMTLAAHSIGLGSTMVLRYDQQLCAELLGIAEHEEPFIILAVGHPDPAFEGKEGNPKRPLLDDQLTII